MKIFKPLCLLMVLFVSAAFAADGVSLSRTVAQQRVVSANENVLSRATERTASRDGAKVIAEVVEQKRADKVLVFKKKRRQNYRRTKGHRQFITVLKITDIKA